jgi:translation initiation factor IF-3
MNGEITALEVRLVGVDNEPLGIVRIQEAMRLAFEADIDLVEIAPQAVPPVCRLMDYGKFRYQEQKRQNEAKSKQKQIQVKEVKFRPGTDDGDYQVKLRNCIRFLEEGDKCKITLRFRGREMAHQEFGVRLLERVRTDLDAVAAVEQFPKLEGRQMVMMLAPKRKLPAGAARKEESARPADAVSASTPANAPSMSAPAISAPVMSSAAVSAAVVNAAAASESAVTAAAAT